MLHNIPLIATAGQASTHLLQSPHLDSLIGLLVINGISVKTEDIRTADPYSEVIKRAFLPIHPSPALVATVLCGKGVLKLSLLVT